PIAYHGDWGAPGRWRLEVNTRSRKLLFAPLEELQVQEHGRFTLETVQLDDGLDQRYKPGYYRQVERFVACDGDALLALTGLADRLQVYEEIFGYADTAMPGG
ncbi:MAG: hypothetical protein RI560_13695, partial [Natronomonas sp.]|nr:hypothetical protein [Natronomonas sp.]